MALTIFLKVGLKDITCSFITKVPKAIHGQTNIFSVLDHLSHDDIVLIDIIKVPGQSADFALFQNLSHMRCGL
jgi:hypothetical protein